MFVTLEPGIFNSALFLYMVFSAIHVTIKIGNKIEQIVKTKAY